MAALKWMGTATGIAGATVIALNLADIGLRLRAFPGVVGIVDDCRDADG